MFHSIQISLSDLLGKEYTDHVAEAAAFYGRMSLSDALALADEKVDLFPEAHQRLSEELLAHVGETVIAPFDNDNKGAPTASFAHAFHGAAAPVGGFACTRIGEDGKLYLTGKSEHYHISLGHNFNGYKLIDNARRLGIMNATHNNTRGDITRLLEREIIRVCNPDRDLETVLASSEPRVLNRVINLETGSVAVEAGVKMMLTRFYKLDGSYVTPKKSGKIPVFLVMAAYNQTSEANYHGTTVTTQLFRGMWPEIYQKLETAGVLKVVPVMINDIDDFRRKMEIYNQGEYRTAGFLHEIVLMNYGAVRLSESYLSAAHALCRQYDTPVLVDEIQSCMWYPGMMLYKRYHLTPDFVVLGKGFPGGEYPASKLVTTAEMDSLNQFGALVTNGQEELASLAYLITMKFSSLNHDVIEENSRYFQQRLKEIAGKYASLITKAEGDGLLGALHFSNVEKAADFAARINARGIDNSVQLYKKHCPPALLLKPPVIASKKVLAFICDCIEASASEG